MLRDREAFYEDVAVLAVPVTDPQVRIPDILEKALYVRDPYTSMPGVRPYIAPTTSNVSVPASAILRAADVVDLNRPNECRWKADLGRSRRRLDHFANGSPHHRREYAAGATTRFGMGV